MYPSYTVSLVDDNRFFRHFLKILLTKQKIEILFQADNGVDCIRKIGGSERLPDLIIVDIEMPQMDGFLTAAVIRAKWPSIKIIAMSSRDDTVSVNRMLKAGADSFISKGVDMRAHLFYQIQRLLVTNQSASRNISDTTIS